MLDNLSIAWNLFHLNGLKTISINIMDIFNGECKSILALLWAIIKKYQFSNNQRKLINYTLSDSINNTLCIYKFLYSFRVGSRKNRNKI